MAADEQTELLRRIAANTDQILEILKREQDRREADRAYVAAHAEFAAREAAERGREATKIQEQIAADREERERQRKGGG